MNLQTDIAALARMNESDLREEVLAPFLRSLGYRTGTKHEITRELSLRYSQAYLGRKKPDSDPDLRGRADYVCTAHGSVRWTLEAKPPANDISLDDLEQSQTYARHPEVSAAYFAVCNGHRFIVRDTNSVPAAEAILDLNLISDEAAYEKLAAVLSPDKMLTARPQAPFVPANPVGLGLGDTARAIGGFFHYEKHQPSIGILDDMRLAITEGFIDRDESGALRAEVRFASPLHKVSEFSRAAGLDKLYATSAAKRLSTDATAPTAFEILQQHTLRAGTQMPIPGRGMMRLPTDVHMTVRTTASGVLAGSTFGGAFLSRGSVTGPQPIPLHIQGKFSIALS